MFKIAEWDERYEVNSKGDIFQPGSGQKLRSKPLDYIRSKVHGRSLGAGMRKLAALAGDRAMEVFGIFHKLLEIAGDAGNSRRGMLLMSDDASDPASRSDLAFLLNISQEQIDNALTVLCRLRWILEVSETPESSGNVPAGPAEAGGSGNSPLLNNETESESNRSELKKTVPENTVDIDESNDSDSFLNKEQGSDSDSRLIAKNKQIFLLWLKELLPQWTQSDDTCFRGLAEQLDQREFKGIAFNHALQIAKDCQLGGGDNPKQAFVYRVQKHFKIKLKTEWQSDDARRRAGQ